MEKVRGVWTDMTNEKQKTVELQTQGKVSENVLLVMGLAFFVLFLLADMVSGIWGMGITALAIIATKLGLFK